MPQVPQVQDQPGETDKPATAADGTRNDQADSAPQTAPPSAGHNGEGEAEVALPSGDVKGEASGDENGSRGKKAKKRKSDQGGGGATDGEAAGNAGNGDETANTSNKTLEIGGRIFVRNTIREPGWGNELELDSARLKVRYERKRWRMRIELEAELSGADTEVRDAYVRLRPHRHVRVQLGRFKRPMSAVTLTSPWDLPVPERGLLNEFVLYNGNTSVPDALPMGERTEGVEVEVRSRTEADITFQAGVFRSDANVQLADALGENRTPLSFSDTLPEDIYTRASFLPVPQVRVAASLAWIGILDQAGTRDTIRHGAVGGFDVEVNAPFLRAWLEAFYGKSPLHFGLDNQASGEFLALRGIVSAPIMLSNIEWLAYVEPAVIAQYFDASSDLEDDTAYELGGAVNLGFSKSLRLTAALHHQSADFRLRLPGGTEILLQAGAVF